MIADPNRLQEVIDEIALWPLADRRSYIASIQTAYGESAAGQIKEALRAFWQNRERGGGKNESD